MTKKFYDDERKATKNEAEKQRLKESEEMSNRKFIKEYAKVLQHMAYHEPDFNAEDPNQRITFSQMGGILTTLGFISSELQSTQDDFRLVQDLWILLGGKEAPVPDEESDEQEPVE